MGVTAEYPAISKIYSYKNAGLEINFFVREPAGD